MYQCFFNFHDCTFKLYTFEISILSFKPLVDREKMLVVTKSLFPHSSKDEQKELIMNEDRLRCKIASGRIASYIKDWILGICWIGIHVRSYSSASASQTIPTRSRHLLTNTHISQF